MMGASTDLSGYGRPFDEYSIIDLCSTGQIDNLGTLLGLEERYRLGCDDCKAYRSELAVAAGTQAIDGAHSSIDWRYRICRWMIGVS